MRKLVGLSLPILLGLGLLTISGTAQQEPSGPARVLTPKKGQHVVIIGNTFAERLQVFNHFETLLHSRFPAEELVVRNLGWSADEVVPSDAMKDNADGFGLRPRSKDFKDHGHRLVDHKPDLLIACFGFNESFAGPAGLKKFETSLEKFVTDVKGGKLTGTTPQLALVSPIAHEDLGNPNLPDGKANNKNLEMYTAAMKTVADKHGVVFVDLFAASQKLYGVDKQKLTFNGVHLTEHGEKTLAPALDAGLFGPRAADAGKGIDLEKLRQEIAEKNWQFYMDYRAVNGFYIYGGRKNPFGTVNFPREFVKLRKMIANRDARVWAVAQGKQVPAEIDDSNTGEVGKIETNFKGTVTIKKPEDAIKEFKLPAGYEINLFASEVDFPDLQKPVQFVFDAKGRLWVATIPSYPMYFPGQKPNDKILILEDTNGDGKADKQTVFADGLHLPTGIALGDGGCYVSQQPNLVFLKDTDGDGKADFKQILLEGFDSADSHHSISAFRWGPGGELYFMEGTFHHSQTETAYGPTRLVDAGCFRYEPLRQKMDVFISYRFANPWGICWDKWGQTFFADASGGANYFATAFSGDVDYPNKQANMNQFLTKQWRPTCGCVTVSSRHFPDDVQGDYLLNNCITFQGTLQYRFKKDDAVSGFSATPVEPLLKSSDPNFRPTDLRFGPDGALYLCDWFNPLVGHMQHSIRDPNRDKTHGRIWRITAKDRPLVKTPKIDGATIPALLDCLKEYEDHTRELAKLELRTRNPKEVEAALVGWVKQLDTKDKDHGHHLLEALWVRQHLELVDEAALKQLLTHADFKVRAAATRVLCYWRDRVSKPLALIQQQANDAHPRVQLEAIRALSFFDSLEAKKIADEALPTDYYLEYTLKATLATLDRRIKAKAGIKP